MAIQSAISSPFGGIIGSPSRRPQLRDIGFPFATGGTETVIEQDGKFYRVHTYTDVGTDDFEVLRGGEVEYLVVAGGGCSNRSLAGDNGRGGAGAGGYLSSVQGELSGQNTPPMPMPTLTAGTYAVAVGQGALSRQQSGQDSSAFGVVAKGGAGRAQNIGGSGAGAPGDSLTGGSGTAGQGFDGGAAWGVAGTGSGAGGGGGAGEIGADATGPNAGGKGGDGIASKITGVMVYYAGGGGGGGSNVGANGLGGGGGGIGGGGAAPATGSGNPEAGGSGIVIIRYRITQAEYEAA